MERMDQARLISKSNYKVREMFIVKAVANFVSAKQSCVD